MDQLGFVGSGNTPKGIKEIQSNGTIPWYQVADMNTEGNEHVMHTARRYLTNQQVLSLGLRLFPPGSIIFPKRGGAIHTNKKRLLGKPSTLDLNTMAFSSMDSVSELMGVIFQSFRLASFSDGSNVPQINHDDITTLLVALPPELEQGHIAQEVDRLLTITGNMESSLEGQSQRNSSLRQSILHQAFTGQLVPQDPNDEPASVLLERIKAERAGAGNGKPKRGRRRRKTKKVVLKV